MWWCLLLLDHRVFSLKIRQYLSKTEKPPYLNPYWIRTYVNIDGKI